MMSINCYKIRLRVPVDYFVVMIEGLIAFAISSLAWRRRRSGSLFLWGIFLGMVSCGSPSTASASACSVSKGLTPIETRYFWPGSA